MLRIIYGDLASVAYARIKDEIREHTEKGERIYLIVPEQQAVLAEWELMRELKPSASTTFEVTNFTRLADTVYRRIGGLAGEYSTGAKEALVMWKTLTELSPFLSMTGGGTPIGADEASSVHSAQTTGASTAQVTSGLVQKSLAAVAEMKSLSITPRMLSLLADDKALATNARLSAKLRDIASIMSKYTENLEKRYTSVRDVCERLAEKLRAAPKLFEGEHFYVSGFTSFTEPQYAVLRELMRGCTVSVHIPMADHQRELFEYTEIKKTEKKLMAAASLANVDRFKVPYTQKRPKRCGLLDEACKLIFRNCTQNDNSSLHSAGDAIRIFEAQDPYEECDHIAADIKRRVMSGDSFRDFAIIARNADKYVGLIDTSLNNAGIPSFISHRRDVSTFEAVKLIYAALGVVAGGFKRGDVITYAKCRLSGIDADACDEFELYTDTWGISGGRFTDDVQWNMNPDGFDKISDSGRKRLAVINGARETLIEPLRRLADSFNSAVTVEDHARALVKLLVDLSIEEKLADMAEEERTCGESEAADVTDRLWGIICGALDDLVEVLGESRTCAEEFTSQLRVVLSEVDVGRIPAFYDTVTVGGADMIRLTEKKHVYIMGLNDGEFPAKVSSDTYFTEKEKEILSGIERERGAGVEAVIDSDTTVPFARELFFFIRALCVANETVTLSYSTRNEALGGCGRSDIIERMLKLMNAGVVNAKELIKPQRISSIPLDERLYFPASALEHVRREELAPELLASLRDALTENGLGSKVEITGKSIENADCKLDEEAREAIYPEELPLSQTKIEAYMNCPFAYYLRYDLSLSENRKASFDTRNIGVFIHSVLENFFKEASLELVKKKDSGEVIDADELNDYILSFDEDTRRARVAKAAESYLEGVDEGTDTKRKAVVLERLKAATIPIVDGICDELSDCKYVPAFFELYIGKKNGASFKGIDAEDARSVAIPPVIFRDSSGGEAYLRGSIDRVDVYRCSDETGDKVYVRVIDYKTGAKEFSPKDINEGKNLQMFLYLKAIIDGKAEFLDAIGAPPDAELVPAGVIYIKTSLSDATIARPDESEDKRAVAAKQSRKGMILHDERSIRAMNPSYIPVRFKTDKDSGALLPYDNMKENVYTEERWDEICETMEDKINEVTERMRSGDISLTDTKDKKRCESCVFKPICRKR